MTKIDVENEYEEMIGDLRNEIQELEGRVEDAESEYEEYKGLFDEYEYGINEQRDFLESLGKDYMTIDDLRDQVQDFVGNYTYKQENWLILDTVLQVLKKTITQEEINLQKLRK